MMEAFRRVLLVAGLGCAATAPSYIPPALTASLSPSWRLAGLAWGITWTVYALIPWPRADEDTVSFDRPPAVWLIDLAGSVSLVGIGGGILLLADSVDGSVVLTALGWGTALALPWLLWAWRNACYRVRVEDGRLRVQTWRGEDEWVLADVRAVTPLVVKGIRSGVRLEDASGETLALDWTRLLRFNRILAALTAARLRWGQEEVCVCAVASPRRDG